MRSACSASALIVEGIRLAEQSATHGEQIAFAHAFGHRLVVAWWHALSGGSSKRQPLREPFRAFDRFEISSSAASLAADVGRSAAKLDAEAAAYQIGLAYTGMLPRAHRGALGIYYTPPRLTARLIDQVTFEGFDWTHARVLDPACGGGAFLAPVAQRILENLHGCSPKILIQNLATRLRGQDIDPFGAWLSQVTLDAVLLPVTRESGTRLPVIVTVCDSLRTTSDRERFDLVIGNPPYGRVRLEADERAQFKRSLYGHANLYGLFTDLALQQTKVGGRIAYVTPTSFLAGEYFKNLRALLVREAPPLTIDFVAVRKGMFDGVLQETLLATYRRGVDVRAVKVGEITPVNRLGLKARNLGAVALPADPSEPWILPREPQQKSLVARLIRMPCRLADWGYAVSTGPLVWNRHKDQLAHGSGASRFPLIWAEAVSADGRFNWKADKKNHALYFEARDGDDWLLTKLGCVLLQRTTAKEQRRRLIAAPVPQKFVAEHGAVVVENHLNMLRPIVNEPPVTAEVLAAFINSTAADRAFRCVSGSVAVSAYELESLPLPSPEEIMRLERPIVQGDCFGSACLQLYHGAK